MNALDIVQLNNHVSGKSPLGATLKLHGALTNVGDLNDYDIDEMVKVILGIRDTTGQLLCTIRLSSPAKSEGNLTVTLGTPPCFSTPLALNAPARHLVAPRLPLAYRSHYDLTS